MSSWQKIWEKRKLEEYDELDIEELFVKMKVTDGYDTMGNLKIGYADFKKQFDSIINVLSKNGEILINSLYEVGCGCGPNLLLSSIRGYRIGGCDYSSSMIKYAKDILGEECDLRACEAIDVPIENKYDVVISKGVFCYFNDEEYCLKVLDKMLEKANHSVGIYDIHDKVKEDDYLNYRRRVMEDYDKRYVDLKKLFLKKSFFKEYASKNNLEIVFPKTNLNGYWNTDYTYNVVLYKKN